MKNMFFLEDTFNHMVGLRLNGHGPVYYTRWHGIIITEEKKSPLILGCFLLAILLGGNKTFKICLFPGKSNMHSASQKY